MKKIFILLATIGLCLVSCNKITVVEDNTLNNGDSVSGMQMVTIKAHFGEQTKTTYAEDPNNTGVQLLSWAAGDEISVRCSDGKYYTLTATSSGASTYFSGAIPANASICDKAYFPADANHTDSKFSIAKEKDMTAHPSADLPMVGTKGADGAYTFTHCSGAARLTFDNIPNGITSIKITIENEKLNLSGLFNIKDGASAGLYCYEPEAKDEDGHEFFIRTVSVSGNKAQVFLPYSCHPTYGDLWQPSTLNIIGYMDDKSSVTLLNQMTMPALHTFERAQVKPLKTLYVSHLAVVDWAGSGVETSTVDPNSSYKGLSEVKVTSDAYYLYARAKAPVTGFSATHLDIMLSDGDVNGTEYALDNNNHWWTTSGNVIYRSQHKGEVTTTSLSMTFNNKDIDTMTENDGTNIYWYMAFPRSAHSLISSSGTVYVAFMLWNGWGGAGAIPTKGTAMMPVTL